MKTDQTELKRLKRKNAQYKQLLLQKEDQIMILNQRIARLTASISNLPAQPQPQPQVKQQPEPAKIVNIPAANEPRARGEQKEGGVEWRGITIKELNGVMQQFESRLEKRLGKTQKLQILQQIRQINTNAIKISKQQACCHNQEVQLLKEQLDLLNLEKSQLNTLLENCQDTAERKDRQLRAEIAGLTEELQLSKSQVVYLQKIVNQFKTQFRNFFQKRHEFVRKSDPFLCKCQSLAEMFCKIQNCQQTLCMSCAKSHQHNCLVDIQTIKRKIRTNYQHDYFERLIDVSDNYMLRLQSKILQDLSKKVKLFCNKIWSPFLKKYTFETPRLISDILSDQFISCPPSQFMLISNIAVEEPDPNIKKKMQRLIEGLSLKCEELSERVLKLMESPTMNVFFLLQNQKKGNYQIDAGDINSIILDTRKLSQTTQLFKARLDLTLLTAKTIYYAKASDGIQVSSINAAINHTDNLLFVLQLKGSALLVFIKPFFEQQHWKKTNDIKGESFIYNQQSKSFHSIKPNSQALLYQKDRIVVGNYDLVIFDQYKYWARYQGYGGYVRIGRESSAFISSEGGRDEMRRAVVGEQGCEDRWQKCDRMFFKFQKLEILKLSFMFD